MVKLKYTQQQSLYGRSLLLTLLWYAVWLGHELQLSTVLAPAEADDILTQNVLQGVQERTVLGWDP